MDLEFLRPLYEQFGDHVSVYLDTSRDHEDAAHEIDVRWRDARDQLASAGADAATLDAAGAALTDPALAAPGRAVFAHRGQLLLTGALPAPPRREIARLATLPHVMPLLAQRLPHVPHLRVTARRDGGEIAAVSEPGREHDEQVTGSGWPVHRTKVGGWSQLRYQRSTEEAWEVNAKELAEAVTLAANEIHAQLIVLAGDVQARALLVDQLGSDLAAITTTIEQEVTADSAAAARAADQAVAEHVEQASRERFEHWRTQQAHDRGVAGLTATMAALRDGAVADLLLVDHPTSAATAWVGPGGTDLASSAAELTERGVQDPVSDRADAAIARALATTSAQLHFLPEDVSPPEDGICAVLRFPVEAVT